jgi:hypothetical protein
MRVTGPCWRRSRTRNAENKAGDRGEPRSSLLAPRIEEADARYRALLAAVEDAQR